MSAETPRRRMDGRSIHLIHGDSAGGGGRTALRARGDSFLSLRDVLSTGPCHLHREVHPVLRRRHWSRLIRTIGPPAMARREEARLARDLLAAAELTQALSRYPVSRPVLLWCTPAWSDQLQLLWVLDAVESAGLDPRRFRVAGLSGPLADMGMGCFRPEDFARAGPRARPLTRTALREGAALWRAYASPSPEPFDAARRRGSTSFPHLSPSAEAFGRGFPKLEGGRRLRLRLSQLDEALLGLCRSRGWTAAPRIVCQFITRMPFRDLGDASVLHRLLAWAGHRPERPALRARENPGGAGFGRFSFRLTSTGEGLLRRGLSDPFEAPPLAAGGCESHAGPRPWVRRSRGLSWRLERL